MSKKLFYKKYKGLYFCKPINLSFIIFWLALLFSNFLLGDPLKVSIIPWVQSNIEIPHLTLNGQTTPLQAIAEYGDCNGSYSYRWDINGDGDFDDFDEIFKVANSSQYQGFFATLPIETQFPTQTHDKLVYSKVQVVCGNESINAIYPILIKVDRICTQYMILGNGTICESNASLDLTRQVYSAFNIDRGLWYLFRQAVHKGNDSLGHNEHLCYVGGMKTLYATGHALNTFLRRGHGFGDNRNNDPYFRHMTQCGVHSLLSTMQLRNLNFDDSNALGVDGQGFQFSALNGLNASFWSSYESTAWTEPIANFGNPNYISPVGRNGVFGISLKNISQDLVDGLIQCMGQDGGWFYTCSNLIGFTDDASTNGWAPEALRLLKRKYGVINYDQYKTTQRNWLGTHCPNGICTYDGNISKLAGNALVGYGWTENETIGGSNQVIQSINAIQDWLTNDPNHWGLYYIYAATKGLRSFVPEITTLPNGTNWNNEIIDFFVSGKSFYHNDNSAKQSNNGSWDWSGNWLWSSSIGTNEKTALTIQMIQSWLEVFAYARATPMAISPNTEVVFDHSWSYTLDSSVRIVEYKWNVINYMDSSKRVCAIGEVGCIDKNGDGDCRDIDEQCNEDINGNGKIDDNEINWELVVSNKNQQFKYIYDDIVDWGETKNHNVILRVVDNFGRYVDDRSSIEIQVSKMNHAPTIVSHPNGNQEKYQAYKNTKVFLDGSQSYDLDTQEIVFGGSLERPMGIPDFITSIHFDLNFDGDYNDLGEDGTHNVVEFLLPASLIDGDTINVPMRVCDDGQWTNLCIDGLDQEDCSLCSYGNASVYVIPNTNPPIIIDDQVHIAQANNNQGLDKVLIDISKSYDPDGVGKLRFEYEIISGNGSLIEQDIYLSDDQDMGSVIEYQAQGDGHRVDIIKVKAFDLGGLSAEALINVEVENVKPRVLSANAIYIVDKKPIIENIFLTSMGDGWYRLFVLAKPSNVLSAKIQASGIDVQDDISMFFDTNQDDVVDFVALNKTNNFFETSFFDVFVNTTNQAKIQAIDVDGLLSDDFAFTYQAPMGATKLSYTIDVMSDSIIELFNAPIESYIFFAQAQEDLIPIEIEVVDNVGNFETSSYMADVSNDNPLIENVDVIESQNNITFIVSAYDSNNDQITYEFKSDTNEIPLSNRSGVFSHSYDISEKQDFVVSIKVLDSRGGLETREIPIHIDRVEQPIEQTNNSPIIENMIIDSNPKGHIDVSIVASDVEDTNLTYQVLWGDELVQMYSILPFGVGSHDYAYQEIPYTLKAIAIDSKGLRDEKTFEIRIVDNPTEIQVYHSQRNNSQVFDIEIFANDLDALFGLKYFFDLDNDGLWDVENSLITRTSIEFENVGVQEFRVGALDTWSMKITEITSSVNVEASNNNNAQANASDDHVQGEEGRCIVFSVSSGANGVSTKIDNSLCDNEESMERSWQWDFGDLSMGYGVDVGHKYIDDGLYYVNATNTMIPNLRHGIQVHIANVNPTFESIPMPFVNAGDRYEYIIQVKDNGLNDELVVSIDDSTNIDGFTLTKISNQEWKMEWDVPIDLYGNFFIKLNVKDGHTINGSFVDDGGFNQQAFWLRVEQLESIYVDQGIHDNGVSEQGIVDQQIRDQQIIDQRVVDQEIKDQSIETDIEFDKDLENDAFPNLLAGGKQKIDGCQSRDGSSLKFVILILIFLLFLTFIKNWNDE